MEVDPDIPVESIASWFDYLTLETFLGSGSFGYVFKAVILSFCLLHVLSRKYYSVNNS